MTNYMDPEEDQEIIDSILNALESDEERSFSPSMTRSETNRTYSPQIIRQQHQLQYSLKKIQSPIIGFKLDCWAIQPFSLDEDSYLDGDLILKCKDQQNSRKIQSLFEKGDDEQKEYIFLKILPGIVQLANDIFGNYVVQRILEQGNEKQRDLIFDQLSQSILILSYNTYGCRVAQKLLEISYNTDKFEQMFSILQTQIRNLVVDINGNHVIQKIAELMKSQKIDWLIEGVLGQIQKLSNDSHGCRLIQQILEQSAMPQLNSIYKELLVLQDELCLSQYGNYIIQILLQRGPFEIVQKIQSSIIKNLEKLSCDKFGSNVVDKSVNISSFMRKEILKVFINNMNVFYRLSNNCYGNYVIQNFCKQLDYNQLLKIHPDGNQLNTQFGQHVLQTLQKLKI
ncbi:unnamed protein product [Paramecium pentaurelia]|uniref:PUM-HD domain-containing protein n=1 Tax=Paramecium pentaurelia TaxID=43138 RepID=A0A8S1SE09_9CILI|nr:unnamed protein product [Paramecium pentaurelia]